MNGGLVDSAVAITAALLTLAVYCSVRIYYSGGYPAGLAAFAFLPSWFVLIAHVRCIYAKEGCLTGKDGTPLTPPHCVCQRRKGRADVRSASFRANVGIVVADATGRVLVCERADHPGSWQFPQGGIDHDEEPLAAAWRELREETGLSARDVELERIHPEWLVYEIPQDIRTEKSGLGQVQRWFLMRHSETAPAVDLKAVATAEFSKARWVDIDTAVEGAVSFKRPVYERVREAFAPRLRRDS